MIDPEDCTLGRTVYYAPSHNGPRFSAIIGGEVYPTGGMVYVVRLTNLPPAYSKYTGKQNRTVEPCAALSRVFLSQLEPE